MMNNTPGLGAAMEASAQHNKTKRLEDRVEQLERRLASAEKAIRELICHTHETNRR